MSRNHGLSRRAFLRNAGMTAIAGAAGGAVSPKIAAAGAADDGSDASEPVGLLSDGGEVVGPVDRDPGEPDPDRGTVRVASAE